MSQNWQIIKKNMSRKRSPCFSSVSMTAVWAACDLVTPGWKLSVAPLTYSRSQISSQTWGTRCGQIHEPGHCLWWTRSSARSSGFSASFSVRAYGPSSGLPSLTFPARWMPRPTHSLPLAPLDVFTAHDTIRVILFVYWFFFIIWVNSLEAKVQEGWDVPLSLASTT